VQKKEVCFEIDQTLKGNCIRSETALLITQNFKIAYVNILCYISKTETRTDLCEVFTLPPL